MGRGEARGLKERQPEETCNGSLFGFIRPAPEHSGARTERLVAEIIGMACYFHPQIMNYNIY